MEKITKMRKNLHKILRLSNVHAIKWLKFYLADDSAHYKLFIVTLTFFYLLSFLVISLRNGHIELHEIVELFTYTKRNRFSIRSMILLVYEFTIIHHTFIHWHRTSITLKQNCRFGWSCTKTKQKLTKLDNFVFETKNTQKIHQLKLV